MILQRGAEDPIYGTAAPGATVTMTLGTKIFSTHADGSGSWRIYTPELPLGPAFPIQISSGPETVTIHNVKAGEIWLACGQSNMEFPESQAEDYDQAKANANPDVRFFTVKNSTAETPATDVEGAWEPSSPGSVGQFSAVALSFAREISDRLQCPVGMINSSWGGTPAEAWISRDALSKDPTTFPLVQKFDSDLAVYPARRAAYELAMQMWIDGKKGGANQGFLNGWFLKSFNDQDWKKVPGGADTRTILGRDFEGSVWYRITVMVPDEWYGQRLRLNLGALADYDSTYFNGVRVGYTDQSTQNPSQVERNYSIAPGIVHKGENQIAIRVFNATGEGGCADPLRI